MLVFVFSGAKILFFKIKSKTAMKIKIEEKVLKNEKRTFITTVLNHSLPQIYSLWQEGFSGLLGEVSKLRHC
jgi:hypothetical protein